MEEKVLFEGTFKQSNKLSIIPACIGVLVLVIGCILSGENFSYYLFERDGIFDAIYMLFYVMIEDYLIVLITALTLFIISLIVYLMIRNCNLVITDKRIEGCSIWGQRITLPLDKISAVSISYFGFLTISTSSGKINFGLITGGDDAWKILNSLITDRQK